MLSDIIHSLWRINQYALLCPILIKVFIFSVVFTDFIHDLIIFKITENISKNKLCFFIVPYRYFTACILVVFEARCLIRRYPEFKCILRSCRTFTVSWCNYQCMLTQHVSTVFVRTAADAYRICAVDRDRICHLIAVHIYEDIRHVYFIIFLLSPACLLKRLYSRLELWCKVDTFRLIKAECECSYRIPLAIT